MTHLPFLHFLFLPQSFLSVHSDLMQLPLLQILVVSSQSPFLWHSSQLLGATVLTHLPLLLHVS